MWCHAMKYEPRAVRHGKKRICLAALLVALNLQVRSCFGAFNNKDMAFGLKSKTRCSLLQMASSNMPVMNITSSGQRKKADASRASPFPQSVYNLASDEKRLKYDFVSFIDYSMSPYSQITRLVEPRSYARSEQFDRSMANVPPTIDDVAPPPSLFGPVGEFLAWNKLPARAVVGTLSYFGFPFICSILERATENVEASTVLSLVGAFLPGISIVLGTYFSLTLGILYDRFTRLQETIALEASLLALACHNLLHLFEDDQDAAVEGVQCIADQIRTLVHENRGREIMRVIYSDPYARILRLLQNQKGKDLNSQLVCEIRGQILELTKVRSKRIADEGLAFAPTHFDVMTFLSSLLLAGFSLVAVETTKVDGGSGILTRVLFSCIVVCYVTLYEMSFDLNRPFDGVYQLRRSSSAMHFLEVKHLVSNHELVCGLVDFDNVELESSDYPEEDCGDVCKQRKKETWYN